MANKTIYPKGSAEVTVPASQSIAVSNYGGGIAQIYYLIQSANAPDAFQLQQTLENGAVVLGPFTAETVVRIEANNSKVIYDVGTSPDTGIGDADTLNGLASDTADTADTIAARDSSGNITANAFESTVATGTAPLTVASTTKVNNLNADTLNGYFEEEIEKQPGITWIAGTTPNNNNWRDLAYGNGLYSAVANSGTGDRAMTSPDGITWTSRTSAADNSWQSIVFGNGLFVAVSTTGTGNRVMTSPDGINWSSRTSAANNDWFSVCYGDGLFVAVSITGTGDRVMTSPDGITWTSRTSAADNEWRGVCFGNGLFVAVASSGTGDRVMTSPDGITWTSRTSAADNSWFGIDYGKGLFVSVSITGTNNSVMTSPDGITWTSRTSANDFLWINVFYANDIFISVASSGNFNDRLMYSGKINELREKFYDPNLKFFDYQPSQAAKTTDVTLTALEINNKIITVNNGAVGTTTLTLPTASNMDIFYKGLKNNYSFNFSVINISTVAAEDATVATNTGWTLVGEMTIESNDSDRAKSSGLFRARKTGTGAWTLYRIA